MKIWISLSLIPLLAPVACAQNTIPSPTPIPPASGAWLSGRGALSVDEIGALTGARFSPAERERLSRLVAARNAGLERLNAEFLAGLEGVLGQEQAQIGARIETQSARDSESRELARMKARQPARYQELMRRKRAAGKKAAP